MNITSAQYIEFSGDKSIKAVIDDITTFVPISEDNRHYAAILEWAKEDGNTIQEAD
tara:strand:- start:6 stop:173 length:168 start_codon:yes stop_codon:yes gene_type:complete